MASLTSSSPEIKKKENCLYVGLNLLIGVFFINVPENDWLGGFLCPLEAKGVTSMGLRPRAHD